MPALRIAAMPHRTKSSPVSCSTSMPLIIEHVGVMAQAALLGCLVAETAELEQRQLHLAGGGIHADELGEFRQRELAVVSFCANLSPKKVTQTVRVPMSLIGLSASSAGVIIGVDGVTAGAIAGLVIGVGDAASAAFLSGIWGAGRDAGAPAGVITNVLSRPGVVSPVSSSHVCLASPQFGRIQVDPHRHCELHGLAAEPRHHLALFDAY